MSRFIHAGSRPTGPGPDETESLLRAFFRSEMPHPWPALKAPVEDKPATVSFAPRTWTMVRSRLSLAASVALLLAGSWYLAGKATSTPAPTLNSGDPGSASHEGRPSPGKNRVPDGKKAMDRPGAAPEK